MSYMTQHEGHRHREDIDAADEGPSEGEDDGHGADVADGGFGLVGQAGDEGQGDFDAGEDEDGAAGPAEIGLDSPAAHANLRGLARRTEEEPVGQIE